MVSEVNRDRAPLSRFCAVPEEISSSCESWRWNTKVSILFGFFFNHFKSYTEHSVKLLRDFLGTTLLFMWLITQHNSATNKNFVLEKTLDDNRLTSVVNLFWTSEPDDFSSF